MWDWRQQHSEELHDLCCSSDTASDQMKDEEMGKACGTYGEEKKYIQGVCA